MNYISKLWIVGVIVVLLGAGYWVWSLQTKNTHKVDVSRTSVIKEMQSLNRLETASFTMEKIIEAGEAGNAFRDFFFGDRVLMIAHARVVAGIDMSQVKDTDVSIEGTALKMKVPAPIIFGTALDSTKTKIYDRKVGILATADKDLESEARSAAEKAIQIDACNAGILEEAAKNARERLQSTFMLLKFTTVDIEVPRGSC
jgi:hypothetical protein